MPPLIAVGESVGAHIEDGDPEIHTPRLDARFPGASVVGRTYRIEIADSGPYRVELRSCTFDTYLVLRDAEGTLLAEDDDGLLGTHSRIEHEFEAGHAYRLEVCALPEGRGEFELVVREGPSPSLSTRDRVDAEFVQLQRVVAIREEALGRAHPITAQLLNKLVARIEGEAACAAARPWFERALAADEASLGPDHPDTAASLSNLALLLVAQEDLGAARPLTERALTIRRSALGSEHRSTADSLNDLGELFLASEEVASAQPLLESALRIRERVLGPGHPDTAETLNNLAIGLKRQGDLGGARALYERALAIWQESLGPEHPDTAIALYNLSRLLEQQGEVDAAQPLIERALAIWEKALGPDHSNVLLCVQARARYLKSRGRYFEARPMYERALSTRERVLGPDHPDTAKSLGDLALLLEDLADYSQARLLLERALAIEESTSGLGHPETATVLGNLAKIIQSQGDFTEARAVYERALAISEEALGPSHSKTAWVLSGLAGLLAAQGEYGAAQDLYERALAIYRKEHGPEHRRTASLLHNLAELCSERGDLPEAQRLFEESLTIREKILGPAHPDTAATLGKLGYLHGRRGDFAAARTFIESALAIHETALGPDHPYVATGLTALAHLLEQQGSFEAARLLLERSLAIRETALGRDHIHTATSLGDLGVLLVNLGEYEAARDCLERALAIYEAVLGPDHPRTGIVLGNMAWLLRLQGDLAAARSRYERALAIHEAVLGPEHPHTAVGLSNLAQLFELQGNYAEAQPLFERALAIRETILGQEHPATARSQTQLATLLADLGEGDRAREFLSRAALGRRAHFQRALEGLTEAEGFTYRAQLLSQLETHLSFCASGAPEVVSEGYETLLDWKGRITRAVIASREQLARGLTDQQRALLERLRANQLRLSRLLSAEASDEPADRLRALREERNALERELDRTLDSRTEDRVSVVDLQAALPAGSAVLDVFVQRIYEPATWDGAQLLTRGAWTERHVVAWIVRPESPDVLRVDLGEAAPIESACRSFLEELVARRGVSIEEGPRTDPASELRRLLWSPLADRLEGATMVFVSPDSFLGTMPLEVLGLEDGSFLVEHHNFVYLQDVSDLVRRRKPIEPEYASLLSIGGVNFQERSPWSAGSEADGIGVASRGGFTDFWGRLPATAYESQVVDDLHAAAFGEKAVRLLLQGSEPTEERLKHEFGRYTALHIATHGFFQPQGTPSMWETARNEAGRVESRMNGEAAQVVGQHPGLLSGLVCAGANEPPEAGRDDGYLTAEEVGWLDLSRVELVVLSACETGLGRARSGEGLIGLRRAFHTAGARTVVSSLWSVQDESTSELMRDFYKNLLLVKMGRAEALRTAQLAMLQRNRMRHKSALPSTWGAFVLSGEWR